MNIGFRKSKPEDPARPRVYPATVTAIASGKGGVGKTFMFTSLSPRSRVPDRERCLSTGTLVSPTSTCSLASNPKPIWQLSLQAGSNWKTP